ncbi:hypothetical protein ARTSIC4J27_995 [Pseudarthrobacter siccitolerans]|uniref:Uncharacterized protein n=1 Tax=Pseudarthrobacter siccitolerans TaxID=861266 RepID=A0A024GZM7_9MICC|nr:hypothetical protein ARTSIC4J27_995 [Pseudarthrobacter siccitolerans]
MLACGVVCGDRHCSVLLLPLFLPSICPQLVSYPASGGIVEKLLDSGVAGRRIATVSQLTAAGVDKMARRVAVRSRDRWTTPREDPYVPAPPNMRLPRLRINASSLNRRSVHWFGVRDSWQSLPSGYNKASR